MINTILARFSAALLPVLPSLASAHEGHGMLDSVHLHADDLALPVLVASVVVWLMLRRGGR